MGGEEMCNTLPDELVEMIISMVPFPSIFKARCLSKSWLSKLSSFSSEDELVERIVSSVPYPSIFKARCLSESWLSKRSSMSREDDEGKKSRFRMLVRERSKRWPIYCPVMINDDGGIIGWHEGSNTWQQLPSLSFLPKTLVTRYVWDVEGALLVVTRNDGVQQNGEIYVANIFSRTWKRLPPPPPTLRYIYAIKLVVVEVSLDAYKVILMYGTEESMGNDYNFVVIYNSGSDYWTGEKRMKGQDLIKNELANFVEFKGVLYIMAYSYPPKLWAFDLEGSAAAELYLSCGDGFDYVEDSELFHPCLVVSGADLLMVYFYEGELFEINGIQLLNVDLQTLTLVPLAKGPPQAFFDRTPMDCMFVVTDGYNIYVGGNNLFLKYKIGKDTWSSLHSTFRNCVSGCFCFQPGLGSFMAP